MITAWLRSIASWHTVLDTGATLYQQNAYTGERRVKRYAGGHQPIDRQWLRTGQWAPIATPPNQGTSGRRA